MMSIGLIGNSNAGKSSIIKVVFQKLPSVQTPLLQPTQRTQQLRIRNNPYIEYSILQFPGRLDILNLQPSDQQHFKKLNMLIYILDAQQYPFKSLDSILQVFQTVYSLNSNCLFQVFMHKVDGDLYVNQDEKLDLQNEISDQIRIETAERGLPQPSFHITTIHDLSIHQALSKVLLKIQPQMNHLQNVLDVLVDHCKFDKVYVFDVISKLFVVTDSTPVNLMTYELCSDMIDVVIDLSCIYGLQAYQNYQEAFDNKSTSVIRLETNSQGMILYLREIQHLLALVCIVKEDDFDRQDLVDYNIDCFRKGVKKIFQVKTALERRSEDTL